MFKKSKVLDPDILDLAGSGSVTPLQTVARVKRGEINRIKTVHLQISIFGGFLLVLRWENCSVKCVYVLNHMYIIILSII